MISCAVIPFGGSVERVPSSAEAAIADKIKTVTPKPVTTVIDTTPSADHTGGNDFFAATAEIIAQQNTRANMERLDLFKGDRARALPKRTYADKMSMFEGKDRIELRYFGVGTTNGDTCVVFPDLRVAYLGDLFPGKMLPAIDASNGGSGVTLPDQAAGFRPAGCDFRRMPTTPGGGRGGLTALAECSP